MENMEDLTLEFEGENNEKITPYGAIH